EEHEDGGPLLEADIDFVTQNERQEEANAERLRGPCPRRTDLLADECCRHAAHAEEAEPACVRHSGGELRAGRTPAEGRRDDRHLDPEVTTESRSQHHAVLRTIPLAVSARNLRVSSPGRPYEPRPCSRNRHRDGLRWPGR